MAIPAMTNNSPSAGNIAWAAFTIQLNGAAYSVSAGSTAQKWVWWQYNGGSPIINAGAEVPSTLTDDDLVLFANKNGIGFRVQSSNFVDGELLVDGSIIADALAVNIISSNHIVTAGLDAGVIKFGTMSGDRIAVNTLSGDRILANTVVASKMAITDLNNYLLGGGFETAAELGNFTGSVILPRSSIDTTNVAQSGGALKVVAGAASGNLLQTIPVREGQKWYISYQVMTSADYNGTGSNGKLRLGDQAGALKVAYTWPSTAGVYSSLIEQIFTVPAGMTQMQVGLTFDHTVGTIWIDNMEFQQMNAGKLIVDGTLAATKLVSDSITSAQIAADAVTANEIAANTITANEIAANTITATEISSTYVYAGTVNADQINAGVVRSELVWSDELSTGLLGARVELSDEGVGVYGADGTPSALIGTDGHAEFHGEVEASALNVTGNAEFHGSDNELSTSSALTLRSGITASSLPPTLSKTYAAQAFPAGTNMAGMTYSGGAFVGIPNKDVLTVAGHTYTLSIPATEDRKVLKDGATTITGLPAEFTQGGLVSDGTYVYVAYYVGGTHDVYRHTIGTTTATKIISGVTNFLTLLYAGSADFGGARLLLLTGDNVVKSYTVGGVLQSSESFNMPILGAIKSSLAYDGSKLWAWSSADSNTIYRLEAAAAGGIGATATWTAGFTWSDGTGQTTISPLRTFTFENRSIIRIVVPALPAGITSFFSYLLNASGTAVKAQAQSYGTAGVVVTYNASGAAPPLSSTLVGVPTPAVLKTAEGGFTVGGDGTGAWPFLVPPGAIMPYAGTTPPPGWLLCDGNTFPSATYPDLYNVLGSNVTPNLINKFPRGSATRDLVGGGSSAIAATNLPAHTHTVSSDSHSHTIPNHAHTIGFRAVATGPNTGSSDRVTDMYNARGNGANTNSATTAASGGGGATSADSHTHTVTGGGSNASPYWQPYIDLLYIIKT